MPETKRLPRNTIPVPIETLHAIRETLRSNLHHAKVKDEPALLRAFDQIQQLLVPGLAQDRLVLRPEHWLCIACGSTFVLTSSARQHVCPM